MSDKIGLPLLTSSRLKSFRRCARLHHLQFELGYRPAGEDAAALRFGTLIHRGLEVWWMGSALDEDARLGVTLAALRGGDGQVDPFDLVRADELLRGYHFRWLDQTYEVLGVEQEFRAPLVNPDTGAASRTYALGGKLDAIARDAGRVLIVEHKTSSEDIGVGSTYWQRLRMDSQVSTYFVGADALGAPAQACLYDVVAKPGIKPFKATALEQRAYTQPKYKQCPACKKKDGTASAPHTIEGAVGPCEVDPDGGPRRVCTDVGGKLYANMRDSDETPEEFRVRLREMIASAPDRFYQRGEVVRLEEEMRDHRFDTWSTARTMRESELAQRAPKNPDGCVMYGRLCGFFDACSGAASLDDTTRFRRVENIHPELAPAGA